MKYHIGFAVIFLIVLIVKTVAYMRIDGNEPVVLVLYSLPILLHGLLSYGVYQKIELSRKISEIVFALWLPVFPIGTFLSMYFFLPATQWKDPEAGEEAPRLHKA